MKKSELLCKLVNTPLNLLKSLIKKIRHYNFRFFINMVNEKYLLIFESNASEMPQSPLPDEQEMRQILNSALTFATEWGENYHKPIHSRMQHKHPHLSDHTIMLLHAYVKEVETYIYTLAELEMQGKLTPSQLPSEALALYPWLDSHILQRLLNIGMYYARR